MNLLKAAPKQQPEKREPLTTESAVREKVQEEQREKDREFYKQRAAAWMDVKKNIDKMSDQELEQYIASTKDTTAIGGITSRLSPKEYALVQLAINTGGVTVRELLVKASRQIINEK